MESADIVLRWPAAFSASGQQRFDWEFEVDWPEGLPAIRPMRLDLFLETTIGGMVNSSPVWLHKGAKVPRIAPRRLTASWLLRERLVFSRVGAGRLTLKLSEGRLARSAHRVCGGHRPREADRCRKSVLGGSRRRGRYVFLSPLVAQCLSVAPLRG